jgi:hypothetical protein
MTVTSTPPKVQTATRPIPPMASINDSLPSSSPSGKTVLIVMACVAGLFVSVWLFHDLAGF